ncbi:M56 family metallopeptidase [Hanstruepera marina]|uniref:M56 family metallopeptidase n=1 Tax=Hanstruepera marina TaxID=2873265 RepID=UPI001CA7600A|nr:M56 family metallopeptidase [Hanstruepera marina]
MIVYILKFSACLAIFMLFYKLFLEKESFHRFKRFYLLGTLLLAAIIPLITFTTYVEIAPVEIPTDYSDLATPPYVPEQLFEEPVNYWPTILWSIYGIGVLIFAIRFSMNLSRIVKRIKQNPKFKTQSFIHVLLHDLVHPHTFLNYIFFNKTKYESHEIPQEVLLHEETHAREKHALDILFIEVLQIIFWFNPLLYFIKKDIKLNHEFLADQAVINHGFELKNYQNTLLAFSSNAQEPQLANAINYSSIKKRFTVMKTHTSKHIIWVRSLVLLPLLAILVYSFSSNKIVEKTMASNSSEISHTARSIDIEVLDDGTYRIDDMNATKATFVSVINQLHQDVTPEVRNQIINVHVNNGKPVSDEDVWFIYNTFIKYGFHRIVTYNQEIIREKGNTPFAIVKNNEQQRKNPTLEITEEPLKLILNGKQTSLENLKDDFNKITGGQKSDLNINSKGKDIDYELLQKIFAEIKNNLGNATLSDGILRDPNKTELVKNENNTYSIKSIDYKEANTDNQTNPLPKIYGRVCDGCEMSLTKEDLENLTIETNTKEPIASFKIKFVGKPTVNVTGNKLNSKAISYLNNSKNGDYIQLFHLKTATTLIKTPTNPVRSPVIIKLIDKSELPPPPPPPVPADATPEQKKEYKKWREEYYKKYKVENGKVSEREPSPPPPPALENSNAKPGKRDKKFVQEYAKTHPESVKTRITKSGEVVTSVGIPEDQTGKTTYKGETYFYEIKNGETTYWDKYGNKVDVSKIEPPEPPTVPENVEIIEVPAPPPPPVPANATKEQKEKYQKISEEYYKKYKVENGKVSERDPLPPAPETPEIVEVPPAPPKSPLDHVVDMAKKDATFYYEGKQISSDKAIAIMKTNKSMNISTKNSDSKSPKVYLSKEPIKIKNK